ncbi:TetR/AcrR family transcriptional regulator [Halobacillus rhizosphaerae]|uniref:TetR/AcrR family transcriptional regulator n=1 Tax=Halobacillus rhizosphaerae TaxID=3064889 RepID=UPI00398AB231
MLNRRKEKKQETRDAIVSVAKRLFFEQGYEETTTGEIAKQADIGVGTLFNYFKTKADLLVEVFSEDFVEELDDLETSLTEADLQFAASDLVYQYIEQRIKRYKVFTKKMMKDMIGVSLSAFKSKPEIMKKFIGLDFMFVDDLIQFMNQLKDKHVLPQEFDSNQAGEIIYSSLAFEFLVFIYQDELIFDDFMNGVQNKLHFIFRSY